MVGGREAAPSPKGAITITAHASIETLNDLFAALFRPGEGENPVVRQPKRPLREALFALFFPDALVAAYAEKTKSNLTWFFNSDPRNKSVRRSLVALLREDARGIVDETHRKCHEALWPAPGHAVFDGPALREVLHAARLDGALNARCHILETDGDRPCRLDAFFEADEAAALARMLLTLAVAGDAPADVMTELWRDGAGSDCAFLEADLTVAGRIRRCRMLDLQGHVERAFQGYEALARQLDRPAQTPDEAGMYCRLGEMLFTGEGCARDEKAALRYDQLACLDAYPRSYYQLGRHSSGSPARQAMEKAAELGWAPAIRELGDAWFNGSARLATLRSMESARRAYQRGLNLPGADGAYCACMLGRVYEAQGDRAAAVNAYRVARENGSAEAAERLSGLDWMRGPEDAGPAPAAGAAHIARAAEGGYCLANGLTGCNRIFVEGLAGKWDVTVCTEDAEATIEGIHLRHDAPEAALRALAQGVFWGGAPSFPELAIALLSEDRERNLCQAAALLGELQRLARVLGERAWDLVDKVRVYVLADHDTAALLLDAAFAGMGELYFRLRVCDPALDAADGLFAAAPLFLPRLRAPEDAAVRMKLLGCGEAAMGVLRRAVTLLPPGLLAIDVYGDGADAMARRFTQLCPGFAGDPEGLGAPKPRFHECALEGGLTGAMDGEAGLAEGNYCVVATDDDGLNLRLGALLRGELMKRDPGADRLPFIAVHAANPVVGWLAGSLPAGPEAGEGRWSQYGLFPFGARTMYRPDALLDDALERRARQAHMLFLGLPNTRDARHAAMGSYYRRQLNRDVARAAAASLTCRMHLAGLDLPGWRLYGVPGEEARLGADYTRWLKAEEDHLKAAAREEHLRRNRMLLALGWAPATAEQVAACVARGNPGHRLYPAKLDPFICPWEALEDGELLKAVRDAVRARFPEKSVPDPRREEEASVRDTESLLDGAI